jgi:hypothetical protein
MRSFRVSLPLAMVVAAGLILGCSNSTEMQMKNYREGPSPDPDALLSPPNKSGVKKPMPEGVPGGVAPPLQQKK